MSPPDLRFSKGDMHATLTRQGEAVAEAVRTLDPDAVLSTPVADLVDSLYERFRVNPIELKLEERTSSGAKDATFKVEAWTGRVVNVDGTRVEIMIPFEGDSALLDIKASTFTYNPPRFDVRKDSIVVAHEGRAPLDKEAARSSIEETVDKIEKHLEWQRAEIDPWNADLLKQLPKQLEDRRQKVLADRDLDEFLEVPVQAREKPARSFAVDPPKRALPPVRHQPATPGFSPEPAISEAGFGAILDEIQSMTTAVERLPRTFTSMPEESLRDVLLVVLNNRFGPASGETFNRSGKTDILLPWGGDQRAVFIAECKLWKGPAAFRQAIDQLLGYVAWRETHGALIVFVRKGTPSEIATKAAAELEAHERFKRTGHLAERLIHTLAHPDDARREIHIALMVVTVVP